MASPAPIIIRDPATIDPLIVYDDEFGGFRDFNIRISRVSLRRMVRAGTLPAPVRFSANRIAWFRSSLIAHLAACVTPSARRGATAPATQNSQPK